MPGLTPTPITLGADRPGTSLAWGQTVKLVDDWKKVLKTSWAIRASVLAGALTGVATVLPLMGDVIDPWTLLMAAFFVNALTPVLRIISQKKGEGDDSAES